MQISDTHGGFSIIFFSWLDTEFGFVIFASEIVLLLQIFSSKRLAEKSRSFISPNECVFVVDVAA